MDKKKSENKTNKKTVKKKIINDRNCKFNTIAFFLCLFLPIIGLFILICFTTHENEEIELLIKTRTETIENFINVINYNEKIEFC